MLFYDHLIVLEDLERELRDLVETYEEREELWELIDEIIHHRVLGCILDYLPDNYHEEFLLRFHNCPYDDSLLEYINDLGKDSIEEKILEELQQIQDEIVKEILVLSKG